MNAARVDRMWNIRDAILAWLYQEKVALRTPNSIQPAAVSQAVGWAADPITPDEILRDGAYLVEGGLIRSMAAAADGSLLFPEITAAGEQHAERAVSVRPGPEREAVTTGINNTYNITNNAPSQLAFNSSDVTQTLTVESQVKRINAVADALSELAEVEEDGARAEQARTLASDLREAAAEPERNVGPLRAFLGTAVSIAATAAGSQVGQAVGQLSIEALQGLPI
ncbi:hypothetical protein [Nocardia flavorosea]|uniref:hypothetical protein n=1 Tax=Nocardia flavorosea TaxID=53429 RepID=UPI0024582266|nr:hypothetical protein [Nocardia flavorosea]